MSLRFGPLCISIKSVSRAKQAKFCELGLNIYSTLGSFHCKGFAAILRSCGTNFVNFVSRNWLPKLAGRRANHAAVWNSGVLVAHLCGAFDVLVFSVILAPFSALVSNTH